MLTVLALVDCAVRAALADLGDLGHELRPCVFGIAGDITIRNAGFGRDLLPLLILYIG